MRVTTATLPTTNELLTGIVECKAIDLQDGFISGFESPESAPSQSVWLGGCE